MLAGALFAFITSFDELIVALFISSWRGDTAAQDVDSLRQEIDPDRRRLTVLILVSIIILFTAELLATLRRARSVDWARVDEDLGAIQ